jgi:hypothetical protein
MRACFKRQMLIWQQTTVYDLYFAHFSHHFQIHCHGNVFRINCLRAVNYGVYSLINFPILEMFTFIRRPLNLFQCCIGSNSDISCTKISRDSIGSPTDFKHILHLGSDDANSVSFFLFYGQILK